MDSPEEIARFLALKWEMGLGGGAVICNRVPEDDEISADAMRGFIDEALRDADARGIFGKAVTPFVLTRIAELTGGRSLRTNIALAASNARLAADIATHIAIT
jgi:pseudouridine-5'-phosphate glycosidase